MGELKLQWQAEHSVTAADGSIHLELSAGQIVWLPPQEALQAASGALAAGAAGLLPLQEMLAGALLQTSASGLWISQSGEGPSLAELVRGFLHAHAGALGALTDQQVLTALTHMGLGQTVETDNFVFHLIGDLAGPAAGGGGMTNPALPAGTDALLVTELHEMLLGRPPSSGDLMLWVQQLGSGAVGPEQLVHLLAASPEAQALQALQSDAAYVSGLYRTAMHQDLDAGTLGHWMTLLSTHVLDRGELALRIAQEAVAAHAGPGDLLGLH